MWLHKCGYLGASPDGLIGSDFLIEVKCPYTWRNDSIIPDHVQDATGKSYITLNSSSGKVELKTNHDYWHQIQGQLHLTNRKYCFLLVWTTKQMISITVDKDIEWGKNNIPKLQDFYVSHMIPAMLNTGTVNEDD